MLASRTKTVLVVLASVLFQQSQQSWYLSVAHSWGTWGCLPLPPTEQSPTHTSRRTHYAHQTTQLQRIERTFLCLLAVFPLSFLSASFTLTLTLLSRLSRLLLFLLSQPPQIITIRLAGRRVSSFFSTETNFSPGDFNAKFPFQPSSSARSYFITNFSDDFPFAPSLITSFASSPPLFNTTNERKTLQFRHQFAASPRLAQLYRFRYSFAIATTRIAEIIHIPYR